MVTWRQGLFRPCLRRPASLCCPRKGFVVNAVLASASDYVQLWQLPILLAFAGLWLVGGTFIMSRRLQALTGKPRSRVIDKAIMVNIVANGVGLVGFAVVGFFLYVCYKHEIFGLKTMGALALVGGVPAFLLLAWATSMVLLKEVQPGALLGLTLLNSGLVLVLLLATVVGCFLPAQSQSVVRVQQERCKYLQLLVMQTLLDYKTSHPNITPTLHDLLAAKAIKPEDVCCPAGGPDAQYVYIPASQGPQDKKRIVLCDRQPYHDGSRVVVLDDADRSAAGRFNSAPMPKVLKESDFQALLALPVNAAMAETLKKK
jgi:hypothetical protein